MIKQLHDVLVDADSLLSLLAHRHGSYLDKIGELEEAKRIYNKCRNLSVMFDYAKLTKAQRESVDNLMSIFLGRLPKEDSDDTEI